VNFIERLISGLAYLDLAGAALTFLTVHEKSTDPRLTDEINRVSCHVQARSPVEANPSDK